MASSLATQQSPSIDWRSALGFSTRLATVTKLTSAHQKADSSISAFDARREATLEENQIYNDAESSEDYVQRSDRKAVEYDSRNSEPLILEDDDNLLPSTEGMDIGKYKNAIYHREGLFSAVYKAVASEDHSYFPPETTRKNRVVALKVTTPSSMEPPHDSRREARILEMSAFERVIPILETFREAGTRFVLVFPFMPYDFDDLLHDKKLSKIQVKETMKDLFSALKFVHSKGIIHRDVKPSNILLKSLDGPAYLADFGIAWAPNVPGSEAAESKITDVGTTCYRPPELLFGNKKYGHSLDLWAAGCTLAEALVPDHSTLFDSGELGSDLALIQSMFTKLGTPNLTVWPEAADLPDWGKVQFHEYPPQPWASLLPNIDSTGSDLVSQLVRYESGARMTAAQVLQHPFFS